MYMYILSESSKAIIWSEPKKAITKLCLLLLLLVSMYCYYYILITLCNVDKEARKSNEITNAKEAQAQFLLPAMAGVKLSSPPLFQSTPNLSSSSPSLFCPPPNRTHPSRRPAPTQSLLDSASASAASSSTREGSHVGSSHKDEDAEGRKDGQDEMSKIAAEDNLEGVLSKYIWSEPSKASAISRLDRDKIVESIVTTKSSILDTLDQ